MFFATTENGKVAADLVDPHGLHLDDALSKLKGLALYAEAHAKSFRRIESVAKLKPQDKLRRLDLTRTDVREAIANAEDAKSLFAGQWASDYE